MQAFNAATSALFNVILAPFGHGFVWWDLIVWPVLAGVVALLVYKKVSNQRGIADAKRRIMVHLLEVVIYRDDILGVLKSTVKALAQNARYLGYNVMPMVVMFVPMTVILVQLVSHFAYAPLQKGDEVLLEVTLAPDHGVSSRDVVAELPAGVEIAAGPVRTADGGAFWRLKLLEDGDSSLTLRAGGETETKALAVGGAARVIPVLRTTSLEGLLYPGEAALPSDSVFESIKIAVPDRDISPLPGGESGILLWFFGASLLAGFALKDRFGVTP